MWKICETPASRWLPSWAAYSKKLNFLQWFTSPLRFFISSKYIGLYFHFYTERHFIFPPQCFILFDLPKMHWLSKGDNYYSQILLLIMNIHLVLSICLKPFFYHTGFFPISMQHISFGVKKPRNKRHTCFSCSSVYLKCSAFGFVTCKLKTWCSSFETHWTLKSSFALSHI